jgi:predicted transcriptional regulator
MPVFEERAEEWKTAPEPQAVDIMHAQVDPVRRVALELLDYGAMRKFELAHYIHQILGKKYSRSLIQYHLKHLERAGLIGTTPDPESEGKASLVYRSADVRVQLRPKPAPARAPKIPDELLWSLERKYKEK